MIFLGGVNLQEIPASVEVGSLSHYLLGVWDTSQVVVWDF